MLKQYFLAFVPIFVAVDALGMLPIFVSLTQGMSAAKKSRLIQDSIATALIVALGFLAIGKFVFLWLGITVSDFLIAGGAILFILSIRDLLAFGKQVNIADESIGVVPLAVPLMVGPAVLTTSLIVLNSYGALPTIFSLVLNILFCGIILRLSNTLSRVLGVAGLRTLSKIFSLLLGAIGIMLIRQGISQAIISITHCK